MVEDFGSGVAVMLTLTNVALFALARRSVWVCDI
jgi:hypothetical protein